MRDEKISLKFHSTPNCRTVSTLLVHPCAGRIQQFRFSQRYFQGVCRTIYRTHCVLQLLLLLFLVCFSLSLSLFIFLPLFVRNKESRKIKLKCRIKRRHPAKRNDTFTMGRKIVTDERSLIIKLASLWHRSSEWRYSPPLGLFSTSELSAEFLLSHLCMCDISHASNSSLSQRHFSAMNLGRIFFRIITSPWNVLGRIMPRRVGR